MRKNITMQANEVSTIATSMKMYDTVKAWMNNAKVCKEKLVSYKDDAIKRIAEYFSRELEEEVSPRKAVKMINSYSAALCTVLVSNGPLLLLGACIAWFALSLLAFKEEEK